MTSGICLILLWFYEDSLDVYTADSENESNLLQLVTQIRFNVRWNKDNDPVW